MKLLLRRDIRGVGRRGDVVDVADGYGRNFLVPEGLAIPATKGIAAQAGAMRRARDLREAHDREASQAKAGALEGASVRIEARASATGRLFGSVGQAEIAEAVLGQLGVELERHVVQLDEPLKSTGSHVVAVRLAGEITATLAVEVVAAS